MDCNLRAAWPGASWRRPRSSEMMKSLSENQAKSRFQFVFILLFLLLFSLLSENLMSKTDPKKKGKTSKPHGKKNLSLDFVRSIPDGWEIVVLTLTFIFTAADESLTRKLAGYGGPPQR
jgi:hypothetical protein